MRHRPTWTRTASRTWCLWSCTRPSIPSTSATSPSRLMTCTPMRTSASPPSCSAVVPVPVVTSVRPASLVLPKDTPWKLCLLRAIQSRIFYFYHVHTYCIVPTHSCPWTESLTAPPKDAAFSSLFCLFSISLFFLHLLVALRLRSLRFHSPRLCRVAVFLIQTNVSLRKEFIAKVSLDGGALR